MQKHLVECKVAPATARILETGDARAQFKKLAGKVARRRYPRPGSAAREWTVTIPVENGEEVEILLPAMRDGRSMLVTHRFPAASLHSGYILRIPGVHLPETIVLTAEGRRVGDLIDMTSTSAVELENALITDVLHVDDGKALLVYTDTQTVAVRAEIQV